MAGVPEETLRHLLLDQVLPRVLSHRGQPVLHASAVFLNNGVIAFTGPSGAGKSTLAASFIKRGCDVLADEFLPLETSPREIYAVPCYLGNRVWPDSQAVLFWDFRQAHPGKRRLGRPPRLEATQIQQFPIRALYFLRPVNVSCARPPEIFRISQRDAMLELIKNSFQLDIRDRTHAERLFSSSAEIARLLPMYVLIYRHDYTTLPKIHELIISTFQRDVYTQALRTNDSGCDAHQCLC
jgi:hypothetical protein